MRAQELASPPDVSSTSAVHTGWIYALRERLLRERALPVHPCAPSVRR